MLAQESDGRKPHDMAPGRGLGHRPTRARVCLRRPWWICVLIAVQPGCATYEARFASCRGPDRQIYPASRTSFDAWPVSQEPTPRWAWDILESQERLDQSSAGGVALLAAIIMLRPLAWAADTAVSVVTDTLLLPIDLLSTQSTGAKLGDEPGAPD